MSAGMGSIAMDAKLTLTLNGTEACVATFDLPLPLEAKMVDGAVAVQLSPGIQASFIAALNQAVVSIVEGVNS